MKEKILMDEESLFSQEEVFTPGYFPEDFLHREAQLEELRIALKPGLRGGKPLNLLLSGGAGSGKTTAVKFMFKEVQEVSGKLIGVYINCEDFSTPYAVLAKIYQGLFGYMPPSTGKPIEEIKDAVFRKLEKEEKSLMVVLDELDRLFLEKCADKVLVDLLKAHSSYGYDKVGVIAIMIEGGQIAFLEEKARSIFNPGRVEFSAYKKKEIYDILEKRVKYGFYDGVVSEKILKEVVKRTFNAGGDIRVGLDLLRKSGLIAEQDASRKIKLEHLERAYGKLDEEKEKELGEEERKLLEIVKKTENSASGYIYELFRKESGVGIKKYNKLIKLLERKNLVKTRYLQGARGRSRSVLPV